MSKRTFESLNKYENFDDFNDDQNIKRLRLDLASSYIMTLFGNYMDQILTKIKDNKFKSNLNIICNNDNLDNLKVVVLKYNAKNMNLINDLFYYKSTDNIEKIIKKYPKQMEYLSNSIIGLCLHNKSDDAHWIFIDKEKNIHNSYNNGLQIDKTNQFCQSYALLMGLFSYYRNDFRKLKNSYEYGYLKLLKFWKIILPIGINLSMSNFKIHNDIIDIIHEANNNENQIHIRYILNEFNDNYKNLNEYLLNIMESSYAIENAPYFD